MLMLMLSVLLVLTSRVYLLHGGLEPSLLVPQLVPPPVGSVSTATGARGEGRRLLGHLLVLFRASCE